MADDDKAPGGVPDLADSAALPLLEQLKKTKKISEDEFQEYKTYLETLHARAVETHERERGFLKQSRRTQNDVLGEKIKLERAVEKVSRGE